MLGLNLGLWRAGAVGEPPAPPTITLTLEGLDTGSEPYALTTTITGLTASATVYWLCDDNSSRTEEQVEAGGGLVSGDYEVNENGEGVSSIDLTAAGSGTHWLHLVVKQGATYSNVVSQEIEIPAAFAISGADSAYTAAGYRIYRVTADKLPGLVVTGSGTISGFGVGGGGSGNQIPGGGGGAGGGAGRVRQFTDIALTAGTYPIVIGQGGNPGAGGDTTFFGLTAEGGERAAATVQNVKAGSGAGAAGSSSSQTGGVAGSALSSAGGNNFAAVNTVDRGGGGGGGAGGAGQNASSGTGGNGGAGVRITRPDGTTVDVAGGGGGSSRTGNNGIGGRVSGGDRLGGDGGTYPTDASSGVANTGSGGGGASPDVVGTADGVPGGGGSGVVEFWHPV